MQRLLIIDDEPSVIYSLETGLQTTQLEIITADTAKQGIQLVRNRSPDAVICDIRLPDLNGLEVYNQIREIDPRVPVIMITAYATTDTAIEAMKRGAFEYLLKPLDLPQLRDVVQRALEQSQLARVPAVFDEEQTEDLTSDRIVGRSAAMHEIYKSIGRVASQDVTVLILGESGTGKELVARAIYQHSHRNHAPFIAINCAAIPESLLESELFGHERGAFTGADRRRIGKFEQARGGTIFLDEIGDMSAATQAKVLRLLQSQQFERVGGNETIHTDVRVIAATNQHLEEMVAGGRFRQDLFYRLNGFTLTLPPLRDRPDDIPLLIEHFRKRVSHKFGRAASSIAPEAMQRLLQHSWPGNVRELQGAIRYAVVKSTGDVLTLESMPESIRQVAASPALSAGDLQDRLLLLIRRLIEHREPQIYNTVHSEVDRVLLEEVLLACRGNQVEAAEMLGISRNTLRSKLRMIGLQVEKKPSFDDA